jgi:hypothetical protein
LADEFEEWCGLFGMDEGSLRLMCFDSEDVVLNSVVLESWYLWRRELWRVFVSFWVMFGCGEKGERLVLEKGHPKTEINESRLNVDEEG